MLKPCKYHLTYVSCLRDPEDPALPFISEFDVEVLGDTLKHILGVLDPSCALSHNVKQVIITPIFNPF